MISSSSGNILIRKRRADDSSSPMQLSSGDYQTSGGESKSKYTKMTSSVFPSEYRNGKKKKKRQELINTIIFNAWLFNKPVSKFLQNIRKNPRFKIPSKPNGKVVSKNLQTKEITLFFCFSGTSPYTAHHPKCTNNRPNTKIR